MTLSSPNTVEAQKYVSSGSPPRFPFTITSMAATIRRSILGKSSIVSGSSSLLPPALFISFRGIASKLFVGGISFYTEENGLTEAFSEYGQVVEAKIVMDRVSDKSKGFGFVTYASEEEAQRAREQMNGKTLHGRVIFVDYAKPKANFGGGGIPIARGPPEPIPERSES